MGRAHRGQSQARRPRGSQHLAKGGDIAPTPGTKRISRLEENVAADAVELTAEQLRRLDELPPAEGAHHSEAQMQLIER